MVEVLVAVAIMALLTAVLLPAFHSASAKAQAVHCVANQCQVYSALMLYAGDHQGVLPVEWLTTSPTNTATLSIWLDELVPYSGNSSTPHPYPDIFFCPAWKTRYQTNSNHTGYGYNSYLLRPDDQTMTQQVPIPYTHLSSPSRKIAFGDSVNWHLAATGAGWVTSSGDPLRHGDSALYTFFDGHVESLTPTNAVSTLLNH